MNNNYKIEEILQSDVQENYSFKIVVVGDCAVGKSNILSRFISNQFNPESKSTIGVELSAKTYKIDNKIVKVDIWDTAGQERFSSLTTAYYKGAKGAFIVFDITRTETFYNIEKWLKELRNKVSKNLHIIIIGNKCDLFLLRKVRYEDAQKKCDELGLKFFETSALDSKNIIMAFKEMTADIYSDLKNNNPTEQSSFPLNTGERYKKDDGGCGC